MEPVDTTKDRSLELINVALQKLLDDRRTASAGRDAIHEDDMDRHLLSKLLSQVESLKGSTSIGEIGATVEDAKNNEAAGITADEIAKELRRVKKQNTVTHWLLSIMILVTVSWQLSEMTLILKMRENLTHPLRSVGNLVSGFFRGKTPAAAEGETEKDKTSSTVKQDKNGMLPAIPPIKIPELPLIDLTNFPSKDEDSD